MVLSPARLRCGDCGKGLHARQNRECFTVRQKVACRTGEANLHVLEMMKSRAIVTNDGTDFRLCAAIFDLHDTIQDALSPPQQLSEAEPPHPTNKCGVIVSVADLPATDSESAVWWV